ncbi:hypothetical protein ACJX0J_020683, partial [Zea mays]
RGRGMGARLVHGIAAFFSIFIQNLLADLIILGHNYLQRPDGRDTGQSSVRSRDTISPRPSPAS